MIAAIHFVALSFLAGNLVLHGLAQLPPVGWGLLAAPLLAGLASRRPWLLAAGAFSAGFLCALLAAHDRLDAVLSPELEGRTLTLTGHVATIPLARGRYSVFELAVERADAAPALRRVRIKLYGEHAQVRAGDRLQMRARFKRPRGYANPGTFDYGKWLFMRGIGATGYALSWRKTGEGTRWSPLVWRQALLQKLRAHRDTIAHVDSIAALSLGFSRSLTPERSHILAATGTRHLFAVSGLHIGLVFGVFFFLLRVLWSRFLLARWQYPPAYAAAVAALPFAFGYALLAGFSLPTQRALVMLLCFVFGVLQKRRLPLPQALSASLLAVLLWDPFSSLSVSFWLSFAAVGLIVLFLSASVKPPDWRQWPKLQVYLSLAMILPTLLLFSRGSLIAPLANLLAVPLVSFAVLPASLLSTAFAAFGEVPALLVMRCADVLFEAFWRAGAWLAALDGVEWFHHPPKWALVSALTGVALLLLFARARLKPLALVFLLPLFNQTSAPPAPGDFEAVFLDVGQGLSVFVATHRHTLLYDTGPAYPSFNTGEALVAPYLRARDVTHLDALIVSHTDNDHAGGAAGVLRHMDAGRLLSGESFEAAGRRFEVCRAGQVWSWDGVRFEILHPAAAHRHMRNNASCVLKITSGQRSLLLTADIEKAAERALLHDQRIASEVLLVPHHGSRTSSSPAFIDKVSPRLAVVTSGYRNSFGLPKADVIGRYRERGIRVLNTAHTGALSLHFSSRAPLRVVAHRQQARRYWEEPMDGRRGF